MPPRRARYSTEQTAIDFDAPVPEPVETLANGVVAERSAPEYSVKDGYCNAYGRTINWVILGPNSTELATVTTKRGGQRVAALLNELTNGKRGLSR